MTWKYLFLSSVNLSRSLYLYERKDSTSAEGKYTPQSLEKGVIEIAKALWGRYTDVHCKLKRVGGDMTKVCYVPGLSPAAQILCKDKSHTTFKIPGTQETMIIMICATQAYSIRSGIQIVVTYSPDESHKLLMIMLSRTRRNDSDMTNKFTTPLSHLYAFDMPDSNASSDDIVLVAFVEDLAVPFHNSRNKC